MLEPPKTTFIEERNKVFNKAAPVAISKGDVVKPAVFKGNSVTQAVSSFEKRTHSASVSKVFDAVSFAFHLQNKVFSLITNRGFCLVTLWVFQERKHVLSVTVRAPGVQSSVISDAARGFPLLALPFRRPSQTKTEGSYVRKDTTIMSKTRDVMLTDRTVKTVQEVRNFSTNNGLETFGTAQRTVETQKTKV